MIFAKKNTAIMAFPLVEGKLNLTTGDHRVQELIHCVEDASITVYGTETVTMKAGADFAYKGAITIVSGTIHIS